MVSQNQDRASITLPVYLDGYLGDPDKDTECVDINECETESCRKWEECVNNEGSFDCICMQGSVFETCNTTTLHLRTHVRVHTCRR